jgi:hypothetical protein
MVDKGDSGGRDGRYESSEGSDGDETEADSSLWWRCKRLGPISGRYYGEALNQTGGVRSLDLRVDIDPRDISSAVTDRISGDFYQVYQNPTVPGSPPSSWRVYTESWIVDKPEVVWGKCDVKIKGLVRFWKGLHKSTNIELVIPWKSQSIGPAEATFIGPAGTIASFSCIKKSDCFRDLNLEVDVVKSANRDPVLPSWDTYAHPLRPAALAKRILTAERAYWEAGVRVTIRSGERTIIDDSAEQFKTWSDAELHDAMESYFSQAKGKWPQWEMWGLLAGSYEEEGVAGIMFDASSTFGGAGKAPERQGFAVFRNHWWFKDLVPGVPVSDAQAAAAREFLFCWVHEAGHAFNLLHSWNKNRPDALSWMNYPHRYEQQHGAGTFWSDFMMRFDDEELIHIRHGDLSSVIMGGDPWASGGYLDAPPGSMSKVEGEPPVELTIRSKEFFPFLEPVIVELRLRNQLDRSIEVSTHLKPEFGRTIFYIQRPDGKIIEYEPILCKFTKSYPELKLDSKILEPAGASDGGDRLSDTVFLGYGTNGFYFDGPGEYLIRAGYFDIRGTMTFSDIHRIRVGTPMSEEDDIGAHQFFTYPVGMSLYLHGSRSPFLSQGMQRLETIAESQPDTMLGTTVAGRIAKNIADPFYRIKRDTGSLALVYQGEPERALELTAPAVELYRNAKGDQAKALNIAYNKLVRNRAKWHSKTGNKSKAKKEVSNLHEDLEARGAHDPVLKQIKSLEERL